jgi:hypothetical protein
LGFSAFAGNGSGVITSRSAGYWFMKLIERLAPFIVTAHATAIVFAVRGHPDLVPPVMFLHSIPIPVAALHFAAIRLASVALFHRTLHQGTVLHIAVFARRIDGLAHRNSRNGASGEGNQYLLHKLVPLGAPKAVREQS